MKNKLSTTKKILITIISFTLILIVGGVIFTSYLSSKVERIEVDKNYVTDTSKEPALEDKNVINILLLGTDKYDEKLTAADSIMILTIDKVNKKVKLCSLMRDLYLDPPEGYNKTNLNYTIISGGYDQILKTINTNFNLQIDKFVQVNLNSLPIIIDKLGGVEMEITEDELQYINGYIDAIDKGNNTKTEHITYAGKQLLNGTQAAAYCRIRYTSGRDYRRTQRHRDVLAALFTKMKDTSVTTIPGIVSDLLPLTSTNLTNTEILSLTSTVLGLGINDIEQSRFPVDGDYEMVLTDMYHLIIDVDETTEKIHKFIYSLD